MWVDAKPRKFSISIDKTQVSYSGNNSIINIHDFLPLVGSA